MQVRLGKHARKVLGLADDLGIAYDQRLAPRQGWTWDGNRLAIRGLSITGLAHEIGHWFAATPQERSLPDFGLVPAPTSGFTARHLDERTRRRVGAVLRRRNPEAVEACASFVGLAIEAGLGTRTWKESIYEHGWVSISCNTWVSRRKPQWLDTYGCFAWRHNNTLPGLRMALRRGLIDRSGRVLVLPDLPLDEEWSKFWQTFQRAVLE